MTFAPLLRIDRLAWLAALLPLIASHAAYLISASQEAVPWCVPHIEGCTSISRAARSTVAAIITYKALVLPYSLVLALFWWRAGAWLRDLQPDRRLTSRVLPGIGLVAGLATAGYTVALGMDGDFYQWVRRYCINLSFGLTVLAELMLAAAIARQPRIPEALRRTLVAMCAAMLALGIASIPLQFLIESHDQALNAIEWTYGVLMLAVFPLIGVMARHPGGIH